MTENTSPTDITVTDAGNGRTIHFVPAGVDPAPAIAALRKSLSPGDFTSFDVETTALWASDRFDYMTSMQVGSATVAVLLDPWTPSHIAAAKAHLNDPTYRLTAHNAQFDILRLVRAGVFDSVADAFERLDDTLIHARLLVAGDRTPVDLKSTTAALLGDAALSKDAKEALRKVQADMGTKGVATQNWSPYSGVVVDENGDVAGDPRRKNTWALIKRSEPAWMDYCAADVFDSAILSAALVPITSALFAEQVAKEHRISRLVTEMTLRGMRFDHTRAVNALKEAHSRRSAAADALRDLGVEVGEYKLEVETTKGLVELTREERIAYAIMKEPSNVEGQDTIDVPRKKDKNGAWAFELDKGSLKKYKTEGSQIAPLYREWKQADKEIRTYLEPYLKTRAERIHADISTGAARTGRMTAQKPNIQNVPPTVKPCFTADPGMVLIASDFSSVEMRVAAAITRDPELLRMYTEPLPENATEREIKERDPYWLIAWQVWGDDATTDNRKLAKTICLGSMYGGGAPALAANADIPVAEATRILAGYKKAFPQLKEWWDATMKPRVVVGVPHWTLQTGRFQTTDPTKAWTGFNLQVQGTARDLLLEAMFRLEDAGLSEYMLVPIHDEVLFQVPTDRADEFAERVAEVMGSVFLGVPITAEAEILGTTWIDKDYAKKLRKKWHDAGNEGHWWDSDLGGDTDTEAA
ncbi:DNA polymerase [Mycobacteroides franklinii]|uniref:DNA polymerase n=1 Tax=Mycobacteroides franklinii TaxID=948102 RepID=UPI000994451F|nr:DNA polymerase [Mycobacteroides franklinii]